MKIDGTISQVLSFDSEQFKPRGLQAIFKETENQPDEQKQTEAAEDSEDSEIIPRRRDLPRRKKGSKKGRNVAKTVSDFTARCLKDLRRRIVKAKAEKRVDKEKLQLLLKGRKAKVQSIEVQKLETEHVRLKKT